MAAAKKTKASKAAEKAAAAKAAARARLAEKKSRTERMARRAKRTLARAQTVVHEFRVAPDVVWLTTDQVAERLGVCRETVRRYVRQGVIQASRPATPGARSAWRVSEAWLVRYMRGEVGQAIPLAREKRSAKARTLPLFPEP